MKSVKYGFLVAAASAIVLLSLSGCGSPEARKERAIEKGQRFLDAGNLEKARVEFRNALQLAPNDASSRFYNGLVQERLGNLREAAQFFQGSIDVNSDQINARTELARLYLLTGNPQKSFELLNPGLEKHPKDVGMLTIRAAARSQLRDSVGAFSDAEQAYALAPDNEDVIAVLAGLSNSNARSDRALALLEGGVKIHPKSADLRLALAQLYTSLNDRTKAEAMLREVVALKPGDRAERIRLAQFISRSGNDSGAEAVLRDAIVALPKDKDLKLALVDLLARKRGIGVAEAELSKMISASGNDDYTLSWALAKLYIAQKDVAKAKALYQGVIDKEGTRPAGIEARNRLATLEALTGDVGAAGKLIEEVLAASPRDADALVLRGNLALSRGDAKGAIVDLRSSLRDQPNAPGVLRMLAKAHMINGEPALAEETLRRALDANPANVEVRIDLSGLLLQSGKPEQAKPLLEAVVKEHPDNASALELLFRASVATKDFVSARTAAEGLLAADPKSALGHFFLALLAEEKGDIPEALTHYDAALDVQPDALEPLEYRTKLLVSQKRVAEALKRLDLAAERAPASGVPPSLKGEVLIAEHRYAEADAALHMAMERAPKWWVPYRLLAISAVGRGDRAAAIGILKGAVERVGEPNKVRAELALLQDSSGHFTDAVGTYEEMLKAAPGDPLIRNNLAMLLVSRATDAASLGRAGELVKDMANSPNPILIDTFGWVSLKRGDWKSALPALETARTRLPGSGEVQYHLAMAQMAAGQPQQAIDSLRGAIATGQTFAGSADAKATLQKLTSGR